MNLKFLELVFTKSFTFASPNSPMAVHGVSHHFDHQRPLRMDHRGCGAGRVSRSLRRGGRAVLAGLVLAAGGRERERERKKGEFR